MLVSVELGMTSIYFKMKVNIGRGLRSPSLGLGENVKSLESAGDPNENF
jgi:hypothetical protein